MMSKRIKLTVVIIIVLILFGGGFFVLAGFNGWFGLGAEMITGCQNPSAISALLGRPGENIVDYNLFGSTVKVNQMIMPFLDGVQKDVNEAKTGYSFNDISTFNIRPKIWGGGQSLHSWAIAIDINPTQNPYQLGNWGAPQTDIPEAVINAFRKNGFQWGGDWPGERDSMHFEWYGGELTGSILDAQSNQKVINVATYVNGSGSPNTNGDYTWILTAGRHKITVKAPGYEDFNQDVDVFCFQTQHLDLSLKALPDNLPSQISGRVSVTGGTSLLISANIFLDDKLVGSTNIRGDYQIINVRKGVHKVEAKILFFPGGTVNTPDMKSGDNIRNLDIVIGK